MDDPVMWQLWCLPSSFRVAGLVPGKMILPFSTNGDCDNAQSRRVLVLICTTAQNNKYEHVKLRFHSKLYNGKHCHGNKISGGCCGGKDAAEQENGGRSEGETCGILKPCDGDWAAPVGGCALGKSPKLTIWVTPHQDARTEGPQRLEKRTCGGDHLFPPSCICLVEGGGGGNWEAAAGASSFFHSVLPGAVQFLDSSLSASSRLPLSDFSSNLLPPCLPWSSSPRRDTSRSGTGLPWILGHFWWISKSLGTVFNHIWRGKSL